MRDAERIDLDIFFQSPGGQQGDTTDALPRLAQRSETSGPWNFSIAFFSEGGEGGSLWLSLSYAGNEIMFMSLWGAFWLYTFAGFSIKDQKRPDFQIK